jgi:hypothetical protein
MNDRCSKYREGIAELLAGDLPSTEVAEVEQHLRECPDCSRFQQDLLEDDHLLTDFVRSVDDEVTRLEGLVMNTIDTVELKESRVVGVGWWGARLFQSRTMKFAAAAAVIVAIVAGANLLDRSGGSNMVWADMILQVEEAQDFICRIIQTNTADPRGEVEMIEYRSKEYGLRADIYRDGKLRAAMYMKPESNILYTIVHRDNTYALAELSEEQRKEMMDDSGAHGIVKFFRSFDFEEIGRKTFDGVVTSGIEIVDPAPLQAVMDESILRLWVDVETNWPVRIEFEMTAKGGDVRIERIMDDFHWNPKLTKDDFEFEIPEDYQLLGRVEAPRGDEKSAIESLRDYAKMTSGRYPSVLSYATAVYEAEDDFEKHKRSGADSQDILNSMTRIVDACAFFVELKKEDMDPAWYGDDVDIRDFDKVLMRWRLEDGQYRVVYGDLRTEDVSPERLAELEGRE